MNFSAALFTFHVFYIDSVEIVVVIKRINVPIFKVLVNVLRIKWTHCKVRSTVGSRYLVYTLGIVLANLTLTSYIRDL